MRMTWREGTSPIVAHSSIAAKPRLSRSTADTDPMRVVAGTARGRRLVAPPGRDTRPTSDRVRESVFNVLHSLGAIDGASVVDLFAGSGALGIEALSRGAAHCTFVEPAPAAVTAIRTNLTTAGVAERATIETRTAEAYLAA